MLQYSRQYLEHKLWRLGTDNLAQTDEDYLSDVFKDMAKGDYGVGLCDAICMSRRCNNLTLAPPTEDSGLCERCGRHTVASAFMLMFPDFNDNQRQQRERDEKQPFSASARYLRMGYRRALWRLRYRFWMARHWLFMNTIDRFLVFIFRRQLAKY